MVCICVIMILKIVKFRYCVFIIIVLFIFIGIDYSCGLVDPLLRYESFETSKKSQSDEQLREELLRKLIDRQLFGPTQQVLHESDIQKLPFRELPPGNMASLYLLYLAYVRNCSSGGGKPACKSTFYHVARRWSHCLKFRRKCEHSICLQCTKLKMAIRDANDSYLILVCKTSKEKLPMIVHEWVIVFACLLLIRGLSWACAAMWCPSCSLLSDLEKPWGLLERQIQKPNSSRSLVPDRGLLW